MYTIDIYILMNASLMCIREILYPNCFWYHVLRGPSVLMALAFCDQSVNSLKHFRFRQLKRPYGTNQNINYTPLSDMCSVAAVASS